MRHDPLSIAYLDDAKNAPWRVHSVPMRDMHFALVDDNDADLFFAEIALNREGCGNVVTFDDAEQFVDAFANGLECDVVFMDIRMPKMDGFTTVDRMTDLPDWKERDIPIFMISAATNSDDIERARSTKAVRALICKPLNREHLATLLN